MSPCSVEAGRRRAVAPAGVKRSFRGAPPERWRPGDAHVALLGHAPGQQSARSCGRWLPRADCADLRRPRCREAILLEVGHPPHAADILAHLATGPLRPQPSGSREGAGHSIGRPRRARRRRPRGCCGHAGSALELVPFLEARHLRGPGRLALVHLGVPPDGCRGLLGATTAVPLAALGHRVSGSGLPRSSGPTFGERGPTELLWYGREVPQAIAGLCRIGLSAPCLGHHPIAPRAAQQDEYEACPRDGPAVFLRLVLRSELGRVQRQPLRW
mmetsp:Transcript_47973/g.154788  ORF Transcript_47973/g.154788 Transcript_47973/m.154788 type:complete len:272 (-) Transcript_47973:282-1097(-)